MAATPFVTLHGVSYTLADGTPLFSQLDEQFGADTTALIGRNGSGKSTLARLLAGHLAPDSGRIVRRAGVHLVAQQAGAADTSLAALAGLAAPLAALARIAAGQGSAPDFELIGERWDLAHHWQRLLAQAGLDERLPASALSGGQRMLLALIGGLCSDAGLLVLDEPSNHLDRAHRAFLIEQIGAWRQRGRGLLLISHDRQLLALADRSLETAPPALHRYGGGWALVQAQRAARLAAAQARLDQARSERERERQAMQEQAARAARRQARGRREGRTANQSSLLLDARQDRAERTDGVRALRQAQRDQALDAAVRSAFAALDRNDLRPVFPALPALAVPAAQRSIVLDAVQAPWGGAAPLTWHAHGPVRVGVRGPNGCGKSTLLHLLAGRLAPRAGTCAQPLAPALLDQSLRLLDDALPLLPQLQRRAPRQPPARLRRMLAQAGLGAERLGQPCGTLSGGERMRAALLLAVLGEPPARLLLLDEPGNHLDLQASEALEHMLAGWPGALVVVSHDDAFLARLALTHWIDWDDGQWRVRPAQAEAP